MPVSPITTHSMKPSTSGSAELSGWGSARAGLAENNRLVRAMMANRIGYFLWLLSGQQARTAGLGDTGTKTSRIRCLSPFRDRKSTRLNSSHVRISYAVFCLKKKNNHSYQ